jgi:CheY-like chemotaxis protein
MTLASPSRGEARLDGVRILVVEDHVHSREALRLLLEYQGAEVVEAPDGHAALDELALGARLPDLILLDILMPGLSGLEVADRVRHDLRWTRIPLVAVTALGTQADFRDTLAAGFDAHIVKPIDHDVLMAAITRLLAVGRPRRSRRHRTPPGRRR